jgi:hypothetical protein
MSQDIAAVIMILAAAILPVATNVLTRRRRRRSYPGTVKATPGLRVRTGYVPRHFSTGRRTRYGGKAAGSDTWWSPALGDFAPEDAVIESA